MPDNSARAGPLMAVGTLSLLASRLLAQADQDLFGLSSDFLAGFFLAVGLAFLIRGLALIFRSRRNGPH